MFNLFVRLFEFPHLLIFLWLHLQPPTTSDETLIKFLFGGWSATCFDSDRVPPYLWSLHLSIVTMWSNGVDSVSPLGCWVHGSPCSYSIHPSIFYEPPLHPDQGRRCCSINSLVCVDKGQFISSLFSSLCPYLPPQSPQWQWWALQMRNTDLRHWTVSTMFGVFQKSEAELNC